MSSAGNKHCYGRFAETAECSVCELRVYCLEAEDIKPLNAVELNEAIHRTVEEAVPDTTPAEFAQHVLRIADAAAALPVSWSVVKEKIQDASLSLDQLRARIGLKSKQSVHYHVLKFCRQCPGVFDALLFDRRCQRHVASTYYQEIPRWLDPKNRRRGTRRKRTAKASPLLPGFDL